MILDDEPETIMFEETYNQWTKQEDQYLWEQYQQGKLIHEICQGLDRYPDDVITYIATHSAIKIEDIPGFGEPDHLSLWQEQQEAFKTNPLFNLRKEIQRQEHQDKIFHMLSSLIHRKS